MAQSTIPPEWLKRQSSTDGTSSTYDFDYSTATIPYDKSTVWYNEMSTGTSAPPPSQPREGDMANNPETGEQKVYRDGRWHIIVQGTETRQVPGTTRVGKRGDVLVWDGYSWVSKAAWDRQKKHRDDMEDAMSYITDYYKDRRPIDPEKSPMANKFLPFVVEKSAPTSVWEALLSRSKGMNVGTVGGILWMVLDKGVSQVREVVKTMPDMGLEQIYEELLAKNPQYRLQSKDIQFMNRFQNYLTEEDRKRVEAATDEKDFLFVDRMIFLLVMFNGGEEQASKLNMMDFYEAWKDVDEKLANLPVGMFSDTGEPVEFDTKDDLEAFIKARYYLLGKNEGNMEPVRVVFRPAPEQEKENAS